MPGLVTYEHCASMDRHVQLKHGLHGTIAIFNRKSKMLTIFQSALVEFWTSVHHMASVWNIMPQKWSHGFSIPIPEKFSFWQVV